LIIGKNWRSAGNWKRLPSRALLAILAVGALAPALGLILPALLPAHFPGFYPRFSSPTATGTWWVGASSTDTSSASNAGIEGTIQVISTAVSGCLSFWVSDFMTNGNWGQVGYYICNGDTPVAFYQVWNTNTSTVLASGTAAVSPGIHAFAMQLQSGTTWGYALDGDVFGTCDMGSNVSSATSPVYSLSEEGYVSAPFSFPEVQFQTSMLVFKSGAWGPVLQAYSYGNAWGVEGNLQNASLPNGQTDVGGSVAPITGSVVWNGSYSGVPVPGQPAPADPSAAVSIVQSQQIVSANGTVAISAPAGTRSRVQRVDFRESPE
jgi:hypothetical protein